MNKRLVPSLLCLVTHCATAQPVANDAGFPRLDDYAWGFPVIVTEEASFYTVRLPIEVNRSVTDPELRDAGVYNGDDQPVPRVFQPASDDVEQIERTRSLPFIPLFVNVPVSNDDIRLLFERRGDYARVELTADDSPQQAAAGKLQSYVVDTRLLDEGIEALDLYWTQTESGFIGEVTIEDSDDLHNWTVVGSAAIADLNQAAASIIQRRATIAPTTKDYLRLTWRRLPEDWSLAEISGVYTLGVGNIVREQITLSHSATDATDGGRIFSLGGAAKIDQLRIALPQANTVINADLYLWSETQQRWYRVLQETWHHIGRDDTVVMSGPISIPRTRTSRIKVVVTRGQPDAALQLEVGWRPDTLLFLAQGPGPYVLAAGRAADAQSGYPQQRTYGVSSIAGLANGNGRSASATLGPRFSLGGADRLAVEDTINWRTLALWLGLGLGVAFVGFMALRILRETRQDPTPPG